MRWIAWTLLTLSFLYTATALGGALAARAAALMQAMAPGDTLRVTCSTSLSGVIGTQQADLVCAALPTATATAAPSPTPTAPPPTTTPPPGHDPSRWHTPGAHEHGDAVPAWVEQFSVASFGHGVVYGGDERSSDTENTHKHNVYKGVAFTSAAGGQGYFRYHAGSNPLDRSARYHSHEVYYRDTAGGISFWQGLVDMGDPVTARCLRDGRTCDTSQRPIIEVVDELLFNAPNYVMSEQWYGIGHPSGGFGWFFSLNVAATTFYRSGENATAADQSTWVPTGLRGLDRLTFASWPASAPANGWFCAEPLGRVVSSGSKACPAGSLPQYIAPTAENDARVEFGATRVSFNTGDRQFPCPVCQLPN